MNREQIQEALAQIAQEQLGLDRPVRSEHRLVEDLGLDSLKLLTLAVAVENRFEICLDEGDEQELVTVEQLVDLIKSEIDKKT